VIASAVPPAVAIGNDEDAEDYEDFSSKDLEDQFDELLEVCWESSR